MTDKPHNFRTWQHWRWSGAGDKSKTPTEEAVTKVHSDTEKDKNCGPTK